MTTVVDASVVVDWVAPDTTQGSPTLRLLDRLAAAKQDLAAPRLLLAEVTNALLTGVRRSRWDGQAADAAFAHLRRLPISLLDTEADLDRAYELSRRFDEHPVYDMVYVALAERLQVPLVTADSRLVNRVATLPFVLAVQQA